MFIKTFKLKSIIALTLVIAIIILIIASFSYITKARNNKKALEELEEVVADSQDFIKWVDFKASYNAMEKALNYDIDSYNSGGVHYDWVEILAYLAAKYGGDFKCYKAKDMDAFVKALESGETIEELTSNMKYYDYYYKSYNAILGGFVGEYSQQIDSSSSSINDSNETPSTDKIYQEKYGLKVFSPVAYGYSFSHSRDFGNSRTYGFSRVHLGNDLMGSIGTPIIAIESGIVEELGWNQYGGWRIGIRSFDRQRYYYYAHLRKDKPFHNELYKGKVVTAGDVIGYLGMTGYSRNENVNNIKTPHLHVGMQLIFDESQKECNNEIWIDIYNIIELLKKNRSKVDKTEFSKDYNRRYQMIDPSIGAS